MRGMFLISVCFVLICPVNAQVPDGWCVFSSFQGVGITYTGPGGLWLVHPRDAAPMIPVTGLPKSLVGDGTAFMEGANCVLADPEDGSLIVGEVGENSSIRIHHIVLNGYAYDPIASSSVVVGVASGTGSIDACAYLPGGDVLFLAKGLDKSSKVPSGLGVYSPGSGNITNVPVTWPSTDTRNALAVDASGAMAYVGLSSISSTICAVPVTGGVAATIASLPGFVSPNWMTMNNQNMVIIGTSGGASGNLLALDTSSGALKFLQSPGPTLNAIALEPNTGLVVAASLYYPAGTGEAYAGMVRLTTLPSTGCGVLSGVAVRPAMGIVTPRTPGVNSYNWRISPNPGELPLVGNQNFLLEVEGSPAASPGLWAMSLEPEIPPLNINGVLVGLKLNKIFFLGTRVGSPYQQTPLPIPYIPDLRGIKIYFQTYHSDPGALASSPTLKMTLQ